MCWGLGDLTSAHSPVIPSLIAAIAGIFLISGLFTPVATAIIVLTQAWIAFSPALANNGERSMRLLLAAAAEPGNAWPGRMVPGCPPFWTQSLRDRRSPVTP